MPDQKMTFAWNQENLAEVVNLYNRGLSAGELARKFGISRNAIIGALDRYKKKGNRIREGKPKVSLARGSDGKRKTYFNRVESGKPRKPVEREYYKGTGLVLTEKWPVFKIDLAIRLWNNGAGETIMAKQIGCTLAAMRGKITQLVLHEIIQRKGHRGHNLTNAFRINSTPERVESFTSAGKNILSEIDAKMTGEGVSIMELKRWSCRYVTGPDLYCGEHIERGSYCKHHAMSVYTRAA